MLIQPGRVSALIILIILNILLNKDRSKSGDIIQETRLARCLDWAPQRPITAPVSVLKA